MKEKDDLCDFSIEELKIIRNKVIQLKSKNQLLNFLDSIIKDKEDDLTNNLNAKFKIEWMNIDPDDKVLLKNNGIYNLAQLRNISLDSINGITEGAKERISWAREFFNMEPKSEKKNLSTTQKRKTTNN